jgi:hypothetical protein
MTPTFPLNCVTPIYIHFSAVKSGDPKSHRQRV